MEKFICYSPAKEQFNCNGESLGMGNDRALYYSMQTGKGRVYRSSFPTPSDKNLKVLTFADYEESKVLCISINEAFNDDFKVREIDIMEMGIAGKCLNNL